MEEKRKKHIKKVYSVLGVLIVFQVVMYLMGTARDFQYYSRICMIMEINIILTMSLALINGITGQFSIGHAGFMAIGAYTSVIMTTILPKLLFGTTLMVGSISGNLIFIASLIIGGLVAGCFGFLIGFPTLRLRDDYLAIVTLAGGEVIRAIVMLTDFVGGPRGIPGVPKFTSSFYIGIVCILTIWFLRNFIYSRYGRGCIAVRENEIAAKCMGVNTTFQKVLAFVVGASFAGIAGGLFAHMSQYINPDNFSLLKSLDILVFLYIGGASTLAGSIVGAGVFTLVPELMRFANLENWRLVFYPLILIIVM